MGTNQEGLTRLMRKRSDIFELLVQSIANWNELFNLISVRMCLSDSVNVCLCVYYSVGVYCGAVVGQMMNYSVKLSFFWCNLLKPVCPFNWLMLYEMSGHLYIVFFGMGIWGGKFCLMEMYIMAKHKMLIDFVCYKIQPLNFRCCPTNWKQ